MNRNSEKYEIDPYTGEIRLSMNALGHELPDPTPMEMPSGMKRPETLAEQVRRLVRSEKFNLEREAAGEETFDEADDFDVGDDFDPSTPYETFFDPILERDVSPAEFERNKEGYIKRYMKAHENLEKQIGDGTLEDNIARVKAREKAAKETPKSGGEGGAPPSPSSPGGARAGTTA